ncbi:MAG: TIR domain-containing protein [Hyphomonadaceae bacterium]|nr:TIR domain-containing protein [Hyphomonadaceae bacterium]
MTVFLAHAPADRQTAEALERIIERRGQFCELDDGQTALKPVGNGDAFVLLASQALTFATARLRLEQRALDAWAQGKLVVVRLDHGIAPVGLRDLPAIDGTFEAAREFKWNEVADAVTKVVRAPPDADASEEEEHEGPPPSQPSAPPAEVDAKRRGVGLGALFYPILLLPGLLAISAVVSIYLANRVGPTPGGWRELVSGIDSFGIRYGLPSGVTPWVFAFAITLFLGVIALIVFGLVNRSGARDDGLRRTPPRPRTRRPRRSTPSADAVFVSYARANDMTVLPLVEAAKRAGRKFWLDQQGVNAGDGWAGEIVRAIKAAGGVVVMCSQAAFESDHVKREIYLADRYKKKLVPVFIEFAEPPEDFEYFFAGVQQLNLYETPEEERSDALVRILGAAA